MLMGLSIYATLGGTISYGDLPLRRSLPAATGQPIIAIYEYARCTAVTTPSEAATRSPYCLSAACPLDYDDPPLMRFFSCFGYVRSRCENEPFLIRTNSNRCLFPSLFFRSKTHLLSLLAIRFVPATLANLTVTVTGEKRKCKYSSINEQSFCCYLQHRKLTTRYNINNTR